MRFATWEWMIRTGLIACRGTDHFGIESCGHLTPRWCFSRFGMSQTIMPDGRIICIGGEHEDWYDYDFYIYNDVVVLRPSPGEADISADSGEVEIYGYPKATFQPTDFHSATLVRDRIIIIGCVGYLGERMPGTTPVYSLDTTTYRIERRETFGACPGWIREHHASYEPATNSIVVRGGRVEVSHDAPAAFNSTVFRLRLSDMTWEVVKQHEETRRVLFWAADYWNDFLHPSKTTFRPRNVAHDIIPSPRLDPENHVREDNQIVADGIRITFENMVKQVQATIEGELPASIERQLIADIIDNLERETGVPWMGEVVEVFDY